MQACSFDIVGHQHPQEILGLQLDKIENEGAADVDRKTAERRGRAQLKDESTTSVRGAFLAAARHDDAPGVLEHVAGGVKLEDMGEALRIASQRGCASVVRELVAVGLAVNATCPHTHFAPLQLSAASGHLAVCELLLDALADVHRSAGGANSSAITLAHMSGHIDVEELLERHIASRAQANSGEDTVIARRTHVLPRVSPALSEAMLQALPVALDKSTPKSSRLMSMWDEQPSWRSDRELHQPNTVMEVQDEDGEDHTGLVDVERPDSECADSDRGCQPAPVVSGFPGSDDDNVRSNNGDPIDLDVDLDLNDSPELVGKLPKLDSPVLQPAHPVTPVH